MGRVFLILVSIMWMYSAVYGQKCHYEKEMIDAETELQIKRTEYVDIMRVNNQPFLIKAQCIGSRKYMKIRYYRYSGFQIRTNEPIEFFFEDNTSVKITAREMPKTKAGSGFVQVSSMLVYDLTTEQYLQLMNNPIEAVKYYIESGGFIREEIRSRYKSDVQHIMQCILLDTDNF